MLADVASGSRRTILQCTVPNCASYSDTNTCTCNACDSSYRLDTLGNTCSPVGGG